MEGHLILLVLCLPVDGDHRRISLSVILVEYEDCRELYLKMFEIAGEKV
jgi:hypothetical protein